MEFFIALIFVGAIMAAAIAIDHNQTKKLHQNWQELASELGLDFDPEHNYLAGEVNGIDVYVHIEVRGSGKNRKYFTVFSSAAADILPPGLKMIRQHLFWEVGKVFGMQDIEIGIPALDDQFVIKCQYEKETREFFSNGRVRSAILELAEHQKHFRVEDGGVGFELTGRISNRGTLRTCIYRLVACLKQMREAEVKSFEARPKARELEFEKPAEPIVKPAPEPQPEEESLDEKWAPPEPSDGNDDVVW